MRAGLAFVLGGVLLLAACGDDGGSSDASDGELAVATIAAAPDRVADEGSYRVEGSVEFEGADDTPFGIEVSGAYDSETSAAVIENRFEGPGVEGSGFETRIVDGVLYLEISELFGGLDSPFGGLPPGINWVEIDAPALANDFGSSPGSDPTASLESLRGVSDEVTEVGTEEIRGVETTHYRAEIDPVRARAAAEEELDDLPEGQREAVADSLDNLGDDPILTDVWIDSDGLVRRQEMTVDAVIAGEATEAVTTLEFFDYGADVEIEAPPADETATFEDIFGVSPEDIDQLGSVLS